MSEKATNEAAKGESATKSLTNLVKTLQFAWFVGQALTLLSIIFYTLTYIRVGSSFYKFWHQLALISIMESFGILIYQIVSKKGFSVGALLKDENTPYFLLGVALLYLRPYVLLTLLPFALFSLFHVMAYSKSFLLPILGYDNHPLAKSIGNFISKNNTKSIELADILEIYALGFLFIRLITFRKRSLVPFIVYFLFTKVRFEKSAITRNHIKTLEIEVDNFVNKLNSPPAKQAWIKVKEISRKLGSYYLVNNYTKEKSN